MLGVELGDYRLASLIATGSMGRVYLATAGDNRRYAVKILFGEMAAHDVVASRFLREAEVASAMHHDNLVRVIDVGRTDLGLSFAVMEYAEGPDLEALIRTAGPLPLARAISIAGGIADGLAEAHGKQVVHRDLKPANIIVERRDEIDVPRILDFGLARILSDHPSLAKLTQRGETMGTPLYMGPEQFRSADVGPSADLYALGVIIYEMITGKSPFVGGLAEIAYAKVTGHFGAPPHARGLGPLAAQLMRTDPEHRPASANAVGDIIRKLG